MHSSHFVEFVFILRNVFSVVLNHVRQTHHSIKSLPKLKLRLEFTVKHVISFLYACDVILGRIEVGLSADLVEDVLLESFHRCYNISDCNSSFPFEI